MPTARETAAILIIISGVLGALTFGYLASTHNLENYGVDACSPHNFTFVRDTTSSHLVLVFVDGKISNVRYTDNATINYDTKYGRTITANLTGKTKYSILLYPSHAYIMEVAALILLISVIVAGLGILYSNITPLGLVASVLGGFFAGFALVCPLLAIH